MRLFLPLIAVCFFVGIARPVWAVPPVDIAGVTITLMPDASFDGDTRFSFNQKSKEFKEKYFCEWNMNADLTFASVGKRLHWVFRPELKVDMGESDTGLILNPFDVSFAVISALEYRLERVHVSGGLDHRCFHMIDHGPELPIIYWNKVFVTANSPLRRVHPGARQVLDTKALLRNRIQWNVTWGYYIATFFGLVKPRKLMSIERPHYQHDITAAVKCPVTSWGWGGMLLTDKTMVGWKKGGEPYWMQEFGVETLLAGHNFDTSLFMHFTLDGGHRFDSKDQLVELGIQVVK